MNWRKCKEKIPGMDILTSGEICEKFGMGNENGRWGQEAPLWNILTNRGKSMFVSPYVGLAVWYVWKLDWGGYCKQQAGVSCSTFSQMWGSWYLPKFLLKGGSLTPMNIASLMVLVKHCGSLSTMEKLSNVMLCPGVWKLLKMGEEILRCSLYLLPKCLPVFPM